MAIRQNAIIPPHAGFAKISRRTVDPSGAQPTMMILGIGTEIVECLRIGRMIERHGERFLTRIYTDRETVFCQARRRSREHFAERWAAKEAVLKALGVAWHRDLNWTEIEVGQGPDARPIVQLTGALRDAAASRGLGGLFLSLSHCRAYATAYVLAVGGTQLQGPGPTQLS
jgi:holo-[acyl-carrier protein] synthase